MTLFERFVTWTADAILVISVIAGTWFLVLAAKSAVIEAPTVALLGIGLIMAGLALCIAANNWAMRSRIMRRDAE